MITRAKISAVREHRGCGAYSRAAFINFFVSSDAALIQGRRLIEGGAHSSKYDMLNPLFPPHPKPGKSALGTRFGRQFLRHFMSLRFTKIK